MSAIKTKDTHVANFEQYFQFQNMNFPLHWMSVYISTRASYTTGAIGINLRSQISPKIVRLFTEPCSLDFDITYFQISQYISGDPNTLGRLEKKVKVKTAKKFWNSMSFLHGCWPRPHVLTKVSKYTQMNFPYHIESISQHVHHFKPIKKFWKKN